MIPETIAVVVAGVAISWQGHKIREAAERASRQAAEAVLQAKGIHLLVNSQRTEMLKLIAAQRAEIALLSGQPRPSDAVLTANPSAQDEDRRRHSLIGALQAEIAALDAQPQPTEMLKLIAAQRAEIALLSGHPRPSDAALNAKPAETPRDRTAV